MQALLNEREAAALLKLSVRTLQRLRCVGGGAKFVRLHGSVRYRLSDIEEWIALRVVSSTSEERNDDH
jgi:predicted DNA-binding transcriptional regulator AlpA